MPPIGASSDWHWGDGSPSDVACYPGAAAIVAAWIRFRLSAAVLVGDWLDFWRHGRGPVLAYNADRLRDLARQLHESGIFLFVVPGNHDALSPADYAAAIRPFGLDGSCCNVLEPGATIGGWTFEHGNRFDAWNAPSSPLNPIAHGLTRGASWVKAHWWPGLEESRLDPSSWISPSSRGARAKAFLHQRATDYAAEHQIRLCYGHTHDGGHADGDGWAVANCGCASKGRASYVLLPESGDPVVVPLLGE